MDRKSHCTNINRNTSNIFNHIKGRVGKNNQVTPEIFVSEIWMQEDHKNGVEIIELNSSNSEAGEPQKANNCTQAWSFVNTEEDYRINNIARERRRKNNEDLNISYPNEYLHYAHTNFNGLHYIDDSNSEIAHNRMNCFTIIDNHVVNSDSSSENNYATVEEMESFYSESKKYWDHVYNEDLPKCDSIDDKRMVWIYSFKNQRRLSENDFTLVNIPSRDSAGTISTTSSISDEEHMTDNSNVFRIASPIPATYIPRLDLSLGQTLSTVTEVSELKYSESSNESLVMKPINNWFTDRNTLKSKKSIPNVVNWMALSPRERRRRFKNTNYDLDHGDQLSRRETFTFAEGTQPDKDSSKIISTVIQVDVEIHANDIPTEYPEDTIETIEIDPIMEKKKVANTLPINISYADADTEIDVENKDVIFDPCSKPTIQLNADKTNIITDPIEKLNSCKWIIGDDNEEETAAFDYVFEANIKNEEGDKSPGVSKSSDSLDRRLWMKNMKFMKSPVWMEYLPITESPPSLHLSLSLSSIDTKRSWFKRIAKCFPCWK